MALHNEILVGRFNRFLQKHLGMKGHPPAPQLASDISCNLNLLMDMDTFYLQGWNSFAQSTLLPASIANFNSWRLRNPFGSNVVALVRLISATTITGSDRFDLQYGQANLDLGVINTPRALDTRHAPGAVMVASSFQGVTSQIGSNIHSKMCAVGTAVDFQVDQMDHLVMLPGTSIGVQGNTINFSQTVTIWWFERHLEESERT